MSLQLKKKGDNYQVTLASFYIQCHLITLIVTEHCLLETNITTLKKKKSNQSAAKDTGAHRKNKISHRYGQLSEP